MTPDSETSRLGHPKYRPDIDGLRAVAILSVVGYHVFPESFRGGFIGVDVFFVISGFLITSILLKTLEQENFSFKDFYVRRIRRIFPALILVILFSYAVAWLVLLRDEYTQLGKHIAGAAAFISNFVLWGESGYFDNAIETKPLAHLWSLGIEEQFYIVWPLLLFLAWRRHFNVLVLTLLIITVSFGLNARQVGNDMVAAFYSPLSRFWELMIGSVLAYFTLRKQRASGATESGWKGGVTALLKLGRSQSQWIEEGAAVLGLLLIVAAVFYVDKTDAFPGWLVLLPTIGALLLIMAGPGTHINRVVLSNRLMIWVGVISYPLYLWHWPLLSFVRIVESRPPPMETRIVIVVISIALAWLTYRLIERPIRWGGRRTMVTAVALLLAMVTLGYIGNDAYSGDGFQVGYLLREQVRKIRQKAVRTPGEQLLLKLVEDANYVDSMKNDRQAAIRAPDCHFNTPKETIEEIQARLPECMTLSIESKNILVIGDSHAADLYTSFRKAYPEINFLQATGANCVPVGERYRDRGGARCRGLVEYALKFAEQHHLDGVILAARWNAKEVAGLGETLARLKKSRQNMIVVGPPVEYDADVVKLFLRRPASEGLGDYLASHVVGGGFELSESMRRLAREYDVNYVDRASLYCDPACPIVSDNGDLLIADYGHLLVPGMAYLGAQLKRNMVLEKVLGRTGPVFVPVSSGYR